LLLVVYAGKAPATTAVSPLSLHDALPICFRRDGAEALRIAHSLEIERKHFRRGIVQLPVDDLVEAEIGLVAGRDEMGQADAARRSEEHTSELQSRENLVCRLLLGKKKKKT